MSCAYGRIIYGWIWSQEIENLLIALPEDTKEKFGIYSDDFHTTFDNLNFVISYSASDDGADGNTYLGTVIGNMPVYKPITLDSLVSKPTTDQVTQTMELLKTIPSELVVELGPPKVYIIWGDT